MNIYTMAGHTLGVSGVLLILVSVFTPGVYGSCLLPYGDGVDRAFGASNNVFGSTCTSAISLSKMYLDQRQFSGSQSSSIQVRKFVNIYLEDMGRRLGMWSKYFVRGYSNHPCCCAPLFSNCYINTMVT